MNTSLIMRNVDKLTENDLLKWIIQNYSINLFIKNGKKATKNLYNVMKYNELNDTRILIFLRLFYTNKKLNNFRKISITMIE